MVAVDPATAKSPAFLKSNTAIGARGVCRYVRTAARCRRFKRQVIADRVNVRGFCEGSAIASNDDVYDCPDALVGGQAEPPSKRIFHEPSGCLTHVEVKVPICAPASSKTGPLESPRSPTAFVTTRSGSQRKGGTAGLKNSDQPAITSCFPRIVLRRPRN